MFMVNEIQAPLFILQRFFAARVRYSNKAPSGFTTDQQQYR